MKKILFLPLLFFAYSVMGQVGLSANRPTVIAKYSNYPTTFIGNDTVVINVSGLNQMYVFDGDRCVMFATEINGMFHEKYLAVLDSSGFKRLPSRYVTGLLTKQKYFSQACSNSYLEYLFIPMDMKGENYEVNTIVINLLRTKP